MTEEKKYINDENVMSRKAFVEVRPIPDPTIMTTNQLMHEIGIVREFLDITNKATNDKLELCVQALSHRIDAIQVEVTKSLEIFSESRNRFQERYDEKFGAIHIRFEEKQDREKMQIESLSRISSGACNSISQTLDKLREDSRNQFEEVTRARVQQKVDLTDLINTSVGHLRESFADQTRANSLAVSKNEAAVAKQFDQIATLLNTSVSALNDKIDDLKGRILVIEGSGKGSKELSGVLLTMVGLVIAAIAAGIAIMRSG